MNRMAKLLIFSFLPLFLFGCIAHEETLPGPGDMGSLPEEEAVPPGIGETPEPEPVPENVSIAPVVLHMNIKQVFDYEEPLNCSIAKEGESLLLLVEGERFQVTVVSSIELGGISGILYDGFEYFVWSEETAIRYKLEDLSNMLDSLNLPKEDLGMYDKETVLRLYPDSNVDCTLINLTEEGIVPPELEFVSFAEAFPQPED